MASVSATVLDMAKAGRTKTEASDWLEKTVIEKAPKGLQTRLRIILGRAVKRTWQSGDKAAAWYRMTAGYSPKQARERLMATYRQLMDVAQHGRNVLGRSMAADAIEHWLNGSGKPWKVNLKWLGDREPFQRANAKVRSYFKDWLMTGKAKKSIEQFMPRLAGMKVGASFVIPTSWDRNLSREGPEIFGKSLRKNADLWAASGRSSIKGRSDGLTFKKVSGGPTHGIVEVTGKVNFEWREKYNWDESEITPIPRIDPGLVFRRRIGRGSPIADIVHQDDAREYKAFSNARDFLMTAGWSRRLVARLTIIDNRVVRVSIVWK